MSSIALDILHTVYSGPDAAKRIARDAGISHRTIERWWNRTAAPRADVFLKIAASNEAMRNELLRRLGGEGYGDKITDSRGVAGEVGGEAAGPSGGLDRQVTR